MKFFWSILVIGTWLLHVPTVQASSPQNRIYLDVRTLSERREEYIPASLHIPLDQLSQSLSLLEPYRDREITAYCRSGRRSKQAKSFLASRGFAHVDSFPGGMEAWKKSGRPYNGERLNTPVEQFFQTDHLGLLLKKIVQADEENPNIGFQVMGVYPDSPAERAGLTYGDILTQINGATLNSESLIPMQSYFDVFPKRPKLRTWKLGVMRQGRSRQVNLSPNSRVPNLPTAPPQSWGHPFHLIIEQKFGDLFSPSQHLALERAFQTRIFYWDAMILPLVRQALAHPRYALRFESSPLFQIRSNQNLSEALNILLRESASQFHGGINLKTPSETPHHLNGLIDLMKKDLQKINQYSQEARRRLNQREYNFLRQHTLETLKNFSKSMFFSDVLEEANITKMFQVRSLSQKMDLSKLFPAAAILASLTTPEFTQSVQNIAQIEGGPPAKEKILLAYDTPQGKILIGGTGPNTYREPAAVIIDLGGDDTYEFAALHWPTILIDISGQDHYRSNPPGESLPEQPGIHLGYDLAGRDHYEGEAFSVGFAALGLSLWIDAEGDDQYQTENFSLGSAWFGVGILLDQAGRDSYRSKLFSQGFGASLGVGMLVDMDGQDRYIADVQPKWRHPETNFSQGVGAGFPYFSYGGLGALIDISGDDYYQGNNYTQGVGYYGGMGLVWDAAGKDEFQGGKFSQGAGVHGAVGLLANGEGDDKYISTAVRAQGVGYDLGIGWLHDRGGNDYYFASGQAQGFSAQNGLALLWDERGDDRFLCDLVEDCGGKVGVNHYEGGRGAGSLSLFYQSGQ